ncbi:MAG: glycosyltransferase family 9 protein [Crocinitomicaceae bacterium]
MNKILVIQTAFIGDVILATAIVEKLAVHFPNSKIDFLVRKGNETLLLNNPHLNQVLVWDKKTNKFKHLLLLKKQIKKSNYDIVISAHRFASSGYLVANSGAKHRIGFKSNPFSIKFTTKVGHDLKSGSHEVERNQKLIEGITDAIPSKPKMYPSEKDVKKVEQYKSQKYICMAPSSVWFTKQLPKQQWLSLIQKYKNTSFKIYLLGGATDVAANEYISASAFQDNVINLAGELSFLESVALMHDAKMNYVNDSGPLHMASAVNSPVTAFFCSTLPAFGFGPLSSNSTIIEVQEKLDCRPCGLHGKKSCPKKHFACGRNIVLPDAID